MKHHCSKFTMQVLYAKSPYFNLNANGETSFEIWQLFCVFSVVCTYVPTPVSFTIMHDILQDSSMKDGKLEEMT